MNLMNYPSLEEIIDIQIAKSAILQRSMSLSIFPNFRVFPSYGNGVMDL